MRAVVLVVLAVLSWPAAAQQASVDKAQLDELLAWLEVSSATAQADRLLAQSVARYPELPPSERQAALAALTKTGGSEALTDAVTDYIGRRGQAYFDAAVQIYQHPLVRRASNFEAALALSSASHRFHQYQQQLAANPPSAERLGWVRRIDQALHSSQLAALLQTELDAAVDRWLKRAPAVSTPVLLQQRQRYMAPLSEALYLYSYRFFKDDELQQLAQLLDAEALRELTALALAGVQQHLAAVPASQP